MDRKALKNLVKETIKENFGIYSGDYTQQGRRTNSYEINDEYEEESSSISRLKNVIRQLEQSSGYDCSVRIAKGLVKNKPLMAEVLRLLVAAEETSELLEEFLNSFDNEN